MRAHSAALAAVAVFAASAASLSAQASKFDGAWKSAGGHVVAPDTSYEIAAFTGLAVIHGRYISQTWAAQPPNGVQQAGTSMDAQTKARRYDALIANAGTIDIREKSFAMHFLQGAEPELAGQSTTREYHFHGDTLFVIATSPWDKDKSKLVRTNLVFVRIPPKQASPLDGAWRHLKTDYTAPDTSFHRSALRGLLVIHRGYYSRTFAINANGATGKAHNPVDANAKAARIDALIANAGTLTRDGEKLTQWVEEAADVADVGSSTIMHYRLHGDTLFTTTTGPWAKDSSKVVRLDVSFVRLH